MSKSMEQETRPTQLTPQHQEPPGREQVMQPRPDHGEQSYQGSGKLSDRVALITGADSESVRQWQ